MPKTQAAQYLIIILYNTPKNLVPRTGLEPVTYGLELHDSIQLSYRGKAVQWTVL